MKWFSGRKRRAGPPALPYRAANLQGIGTRAGQEDAFAFVNVLDPDGMEKRGLLAVVADGMGGMQGGRMASETAVACIKSDFQAMDPGGNLAAQLHESAFRANRAVWSALGGVGGTTVVACILHRGQLYFVSVGDSFLYLSRNGRLFRLNRAQNVRHLRYLDAIRRGSADPTGGNKDPERDALTQFLGMEDLDDVDGLHRPLPLLEGDTLLLCSDGVGGVLTEECIGRCLGQPTPQKACDALERCILQKNDPYQDNFTALVIQYGSNPPSAGQEPERCG